MGRVTVQMSDKCHRVLKMYAVLKDMTVSEVAYDMMRLHIHKDAKENDQVKALLDFHGIALDPRV
tara:strand:- start:157 stop:351 length:195 start_codon:yes stop_codon:yes gene_type:complete